MTRNDLSRSVKDFAVSVHTTLHMEQTIEDALTSLRRRKIDEKIIYFYVIDDEGRLQGIVPTRQLLLKERHCTIKEIMLHSVVRLKEDQTLEEAMELLSTHHLLALPVVDKEQRFLGVIDVQMYLEESFDIADARHSNDVFQILGLTLEMGKRKSPWKSYRIRMPWILCNMAGGIACAAISFLYQAVLAKVLLLAMFIPLILTLSESIAMQSMTQSLHLVRQPNISSRRVLHRILLEGKMVVLLALTCGIAIGLISLLWGGGFMPSLTIASSLFVSITLSASAGASVPLLLYSRSLDPKVASGPVVLMFSDVITTTIYLSLATWLLL
ncbi:MAG: magnesium transporter [Verrucomicrobia bacterium]|nr:magnesium transporter [Verrucomicrobiota bacterium]